MKKIIVAALAVLLILLSLNALADTCSYTGGAHEYSMYDVSKPTCTENGYIYLRCKCGAEDTQVTSAYGHSWNEYKREEPDCTHAGKSYLECSECHERTTKKLKATGHSYGKWTIEKEATCAEEGSKTARCEKCGATTHVAIECTPHSFGGWTIVTEATDSHVGTKMNTCTVCGNSVTENFYPDGTLYRGMSKCEEVKTLQKQLIDMGYLNDKADGIFGKKTEQAVRDYQTAAGQEVTGVAFPKTQETLEFDWMVKSGMATPVPDATPKPEIYAYCEAQPDGTVAYCENHKAMVEFEATLLAAANSDARRLTAYGQLETLWQNELDRMYEEWMSLIDDAEEQRTIKEQQNTFHMTLAILEKAWTQQELSDLEIAQNRVAALRNQCVTLCGILMEEFTGE